MPTFIILSHDPKNGKKYHDRIKAATSQEALLVFKNQYPQLKIESVEDTELIENILYWMDSNFGHDLTNIVINGTIISRGVSTAFDSPALKRFQQLQLPITVLLQAGFSHNFRDKKWSDIATNVGTTHVLGHFSGINKMHFPELKSALATSIHHIQEHLNNQRG